MSSGNGLTRSQISEHSPPSNSQSSSVTSIDSRPRNVEQAALLPVTIDGERPSNSCNSTQLPTLSPLRISDGRGDSVLFQGSAANRVPDDSAGEESERSGTVSPARDMSNNHVIQDGLGLVLRDRSRHMSSGTIARPGTQPLPHSSAAQSPIAHNWQSNKHSVKSRLFYLLSTGALADITFLIGGETPMSSSVMASVRESEQFKAHKFVLSMSSAVFDAMFNGQMSNTQEEVITIPDVEPSAFAALLTFLYTDEINIEAESVMSVLYAAKKYAIPALEQECVEFLKDNISSDNAFMLLTQARLFDEPGLAKLCLDAIDKNTTEALASECFVDVDLETLCTVLSRDTLGIRESQLFLAVTKWAEHACIKQELEITGGNQRKVLGGVLKLIRYPLMTVEEFAVQVAQTKLLTDPELVELFLYFTINPKPEIAFSDSPRCCLSGKEQIVSRFCQVDHRWGYSGTSDRIKFLVTKKIYIAGFGVYGSVHGSAEYSAVIEILSADTQRVLSSTDSAFQCDGTSSTFRVMFKEPVEILPCIHYIAAVTLKGPDSYYGSKGLRKVTHESVNSGKVSFQFSYAAGNNNGTSVEDGQIPEIIFYT